MTNPTSNYGFVLPTSSDLVTDLPADFDVALQGVDTRLKALQPGTTLGDIAYSSATANTNTRLAVGTNGQVLAVAGGVPAWTTTADVTPLTTKGDLFTFDTADARLGVGTNGQTLVADSTASTGLKWATPSGSAAFVGCSASARASQSIANNTQTAIALNTEQFDTSSMHSTTVNNSRFTIPAGYTGYWLFTATSGFDPLTANNMMLRFYKNGSQIGPAIFSGNTNASTLTSVSIANVLSLTAGDYVELFIYQSSGVAATTLVSGGEDFTFMNCSFIGA